VALAVNAGAVAIPETLVTAAIAVKFPGKVPLAPVDVAVKVTLAPCTGPLTSLTMACSAVVKGAPTSATCGVPAVAAIEVLSRFSLTGILNGLLPAPLAVMMTLPFNVCAARPVVITDTLIVLLAVLPEPGVAISQAESVPTVKLKLAPLEVTLSGCEAGVIPTAPVNVNDGGFEPAFGSEVVISPLQYVRSACVTVPAARGSLGSFGGAIWPIAAVIRSMSI